MHHVFTFVNSASPQRPIRILLVLSLLGPAPVTAIELYRCSRDGAVEFRQTPCPGGEQTLTEVTDQSRGMTPVEPALRLPKRQDLKRSKSPSQKRRNDERCWKTRLRLEKVERRLRGGYRASQYEALHRKQEEYAGYLKRFCR